MKKIVTYTSLVRRKGELRDQYEETVNQMRGDQTFIPEVGRAILAEILEELYLVCARMKARDMKVRNPIVSRVYVQLPFGFLFECTISEDEIPF